ncbi:MAG: threonylcarbamoyl-AMP synthase [Deltaproteobacteria bacterium]|nr:threonylcarbamoyl-AMP synthase [Deltaproteobacteria bacterium]
MLIKINPENPQKRLLRNAIDVLSAGGLIAYPTDTAYGIGCDLFNKKAIERIYRIKQQPKNKPFSFICSDLKDISTFAQVSNYAYKTMKRLLPGPYTFILQASSEVPRIMLTKRKTVGIRIPDNKIALTLVRMFGHPIISTTANLPGSQAFSDPMDIEERLGHALDLVVDGGAKLPEPSSVVNMVEDIPIVLRAGKGDVSIFE